MSQVKVLAFCFFFGGAAVAQTSTITVSDLPTRIVMSSGTLPEGSAKLGPALFPDISITGVTDERVNVKPCFGSPAEDHRIIAALAEGGRTVESDSAPRSAVNFRDIDTVQGVAIASMRDHLREVFQAKDFLIE